MISIMRAARALLAPVLILLVLMLPGAWAQTTDAAAKPKEALEALVAPIALYPDSLLTQVLMAATYPLEIVQAARWVKANPNLKGEALQSAVQAQPWDPSVKALTAVPQVLQMMNEQLDWTQELGDAFLAQQKDLMTAVQVLRARAQAAGKLASTSQQNVSTADGASGTVIVIQQADPQVVYVPVYNPTVIYGPWLYPAYPPYYWYPRGYVAGNVVAFTVGVAIGAAIWGGYDWHRHDVTININNYNRYNHTTINTGEWRHDAAHRRAVPYSNAAMRDRYAKSGVADAGKREPYRGRAAPGAGPAPAAAQRDFTGQGPRAFDGVDRGAEIRRDSDRGARSLGSAQQQNRQGRRGAAPVPQRQR